MFCIPSCSKFLNSLYDNRFQMYQAQIALLNSNFLIQLLITSFTWIFQKLLKLTIFKREFLIFSGFSVQDFIHTFPLSGALGLFDSVILRAYLRDCLNRLAFLSLNNFQICALYSMTMITFFMAVLTACCYCTHFFISLYSDWHIPKEAPWGHIHTCLHHRDIPALDTITINSTW